MSHTEMNTSALSIALLRRHYDDPSLMATLSSVAGGDIHRSFVAQVVSDRAGPKRLFLKQNHSHFASVLAAESQALDFFQQSVMAEYYPKPILFDDGASELEQTHCTLLMEYHDLEPFSYENAALLGECLAKQHSIHGELFGWECDNFIGTTPQANQWCEGWPVFFAEQRLAPQLALAAHRGLNPSVVSLVQLLIDNLSDYFSDFLENEIAPSLLHGDLWAGNLAIRRLNGGPLFYDPAPYFGDPEADIAMTRLFGQLPESFYTAYHRVHPVREGWAKRAKVYDLYHLLNHFNLFGVSYEHSISSLLRDIG